jgi:hypothetical protein
MDHVPWITTSTFREITMTGDEEAMRMGFAFKTAVAGTKRSGYSQSGSDSAAKMRLRLQALAAAAHLAEAAAPRWEGHSPRCWRAKVLDAGDATCLRWI